MIEKIKNYLYLDEIKAGEQEEFSIITVYPNLNYEDTNLEEDESRAIENSHNVNLCKYTISVRSREAQQEVKALLGVLGFPSRECSGCTIDLNSAEAQDLYTPLNRNWFSISTPRNDLREYLVSKSGLALKLTLSIDRLQEFKQAIRELRKKYYRNMWLDGDKFIIG